MKTNVKAMILFIALLLSPTLMKLRFILWWKDTQILWMKCKLEVAKRENRIIQEQRSLAS